jgi:hypothetical protein
MRGAGGKKVKIKKVKVPEKEEATATPDSRAVFSETPHPALTCHPMP